MLRWRAKFARENVLESPLNLCSFGGWIMSLMRQVSLLAAGCQPWNLDVCAASSNGDRFAYCATLAVYVYEVGRFELLITVTKGKPWNVPNHWFWPFPARF